jgi:hypothetical protein
LVQQVIQRRNNTVPHHRIHDDFPLRGLVRCATCSYLLTAGWSQGSHARYAYYTCNHRPCRRWRKSLPAKGIHGEFEAFLPELTLPTGWTDMTIEALQARSFEDLHLSRTAAAKRRERIRDLQAQTQEVVAMRASRLLSDEEFVAQRDRLRRKLIDLQADGSTGTAQPLSQSEANGLVEGLLTFLDFGQGSRQRRRRRSASCCFQQDMCTSEFERRKKGYCSEFLREPTMGHLTWSAARRDGKTDNFSGGVHRGDGRDALRDNL